MPAIETLDFNLHQRVGIRLCTDDPSSAVQLGRHFGLGPGAVGESPDIVIERVGHIPSEGSLRTLGWAEFDDRSFLIARGANGRTRIALDEVGEPGLRITHEGPLSAIPLLRPILNLLALSKGLIPVHGAAFIHGGVGTVVSGWSRSGKTGVLLTYMSRGAEYIAADWVYIDRQGTLHGAVEPVRVRHSHLNELPEYRHRLTASRRLRVRALNAAAEAYGSIPVRIHRRVPGGVPTGLRIAEGLAKRASVDVAADRLFPGTVRAGAARLDRLLLTIAHREPEIRVATEPPARAASRLASIVREASGELASSYLLFRYAFPDRRSRLLDNFEALISEPLEAMLSGRDLRAVHHPYPVSPERFFNAVESA